MRGGFWPSLSLMMWAGAVGEDDVIESESRHRHRRLRLCRCRAEQAGGDGRRLGDS